MITQPTPRKRWAIAFLFVLLSCSNSSEAGKSSFAPGIKPVINTNGQPVPLGSSENPALSGATSSSKSNATTPNEVSIGSKDNPTTAPNGVDTKATSRTSTDADQTNTTYPPTIPSAPSTFAPRFLSFNCSVVVRDYVGTAPQGGQALEVLVQTQGQTSGGVWAEATSKNFRKRVGLKLDTNGSGRTVLVAPDGYVVQLKIYAASTFEPSSLMCQASN